MAKTKNFSIRFDEEQLSFAKKELGDKKEQEVVDLLLKEFYEVSNPPKSIFKKKEVITEIPEIKKQSKVVVKNLNKQSISQNESIDTTCNHKQTSYSEYTLEQLEKFKKQHEDEIPNLSGNLGTSRKKLLNKWINEINTEIFVKTQVK